jgi:dynein heavy chain
MGQKEGHWIYLANCHLLLSWMPQLDKIIDIMKEGRSHPSFRLWLSSKPHPRLPITLLQTSIKVSAEQPKVNKLINEINKYITTNIIYICSI